MDREDLERRIGELESQLKEEQARPRTSERPLTTQSFLLALPIVLTVGLGFVANYYQSTRQHTEQLAVLRHQGQLERDKQALLAQEAGRARLAEANRTYTLQERDAKAQLARQEREFAANSAAARNQFAQQQTTLRLQNQAQQAQQAREFEQTLERQRRQNEVEIIMKASEVPTSLTPEQQDVQRARNLLWFADAGYVQVPAEMRVRLREAGNVRQGESVPLPVVQPAGGTAAVANFQREQDLPADGMLGPRTCASVYTAERDSPGSADPDMLARCRERYPQRRD